MNSEKSRRQSFGNRRNKTEKPRTGGAKKTSGRESIWRIGESESQEKPARAGRSKDTTKTPQRRTTAKSTRTSSVDEKPKRTYDSKRKEPAKSNSRGFSASKNYKSGEERPRNVKPVVKSRQYDENKPKKVIIRGKKTAKDEVRLNKFIANSGVCSRREADELIEAGVITVNGTVISELGAKVKLTDDVRFNGQRLQGEKKVYVLLNKPKGYVTTLEDPHADKTVMDLIEGACTERVYPVGRLDKNTTGVLLFTNDGELTKKLTHPSNRKVKIYHIFLDKKVNQDDLVKLVDGFDLEDGFAHADSVDYVDSDKSQVGVEIHSGRNRIVRRMFEHLGYKVIKLDRVYFAGLTKKNLKRGEWRILTPKEVSMLQMGAYK